MIYARWKTPNCLFLFPLLFQSDVIVGTFDPETTALNSNKQQDGTKVDLRSVFTLRRTDGGLARRPLPLADPLSRAYEARETIKP